MGHANSRHAAALLRFQRPAQVVQSKRFEQKAIESKKLLPLGLGRAHRQKQRFGASQGTDSLRQLSAGDSGHLEIYQQHIRARRLIGGEQLERGPGVVGAKHLVALMSEKQSHEFEAHGVIIHQKNLVPGLDSSRPGYQAEDAS
jgi:hypothetical protein